MSVLFIVNQRNPINTIFIFIGVINFLALFIRLIGAEFIAIVLLIVYTGVISVLFLFTIIIYEPNMIVRFRYRKQKLWGVAVLLFLFANFVCICCLPSLAILGVLNPEQYFYVLDIEYLRVLYNDY
jgi:NADH-quinone oxidoreductase subunit J